MTKIAILLAASEYDNSSPLTACKNDLEMMERLLESSGEFSNILTSLNDSSSVAQDKIIDFIKGFDGQQIEQIFFYFSGHGYRDSSNFYFCFKDTDIKLLKSTTITNDVIDSYLKRLNPKVAVKVVDACYSGESYIKEAEDSLIRKSLNKQYTFDEVYFMYSSRGDETSGATAKYSKFTKLFFDAISHQKQSDKITYKAVIDYISDVSERELSHTPIFVTQGAYLAYLFDNLKIPKELLLTIDSSSAEPNKLSTPLEPTTSLLDMVKAQAQSYCTENEGLGKIKQIFSLLEAYPFSQDLLNLFDIKASKSDHIIFNSKDIASWLISNSEKEDYLVEERYKTIEVKEKKYVQYPKKPGSTKTTSRSLWSSLLGVESDDDYRLEDIVVEKKVLDGIKYLVSIEQVFLSLNFVPKEAFQNLKNYSANFAIIFSKKEAVIFYSIEKLKLSSWNTTTSPECSKWNYLTLLLKNDHKDEINKIHQKIEGFIIDDIKKSLISSKSNVTQVASNLPIAIPKRTNQKA